jgi:hypothetical protein
MAVDAGATVGGTRVGVGAPSNSSAPGASVGVGFDDDGTAQALISNASISRINRMRMSGSLLQHTTPTGVNNYVSTIVL